MAEVINIHRKPPIALGLGVVNAPPTAPVEEKLDLGIIAKVIRGVRFRFDGAVPRIVVEEMTGPWFAGQPESRFTAHVDAIFHTLTGINRLCEH